MNDVMLGSLPFVITMFVMIALLVIFPQIALFLPGTRRGSFVLRGTRCHRKRGLQRSCGAQERDKIDRGSHACVV